MHNDNETTYKIRRHYQDPNMSADTIATGLTLEEAQAHCNSPETLWRTCTTREGIERTEKYGPWFDGYTAE